MLQDFNLIAQRAVEFLMERIDGKEYAPRMELITAEFDCLEPIILPHA
jgi:DNA-binding LacI/PurR family transcriptional regulator